VALFMEENYNNRERFSSIMVSPLWEESLFFAFVLCQMLTSAAASRLTPSSEEGLREL
jgi:hypothetical protein